MMVWCLTPQWTHSFVPVVRTPSLNMFVIRVVLSHFNLVFPVFVSMLAALFLRDLTYQSMYWLVILMWWP